jgi:hypothetical protein
MLISLLMVGLALAVMAMMAGPAVKDAELIKTAALPVGTASTYTAGIQIHSGSGDFVAPAEFVVEVPALTAAQLPDTKTITFIVQSDNDSAFGSPTTVSPSLVVTGSGTDGSAAASLAIRFPSTVEKYLRVKATGVATVDASASSMTGSLKF